ncbi:hypothetical protein L1887_42912 [Cichorium endivia]|nr:hypothetical protein L1887_42912 [Cichorium endivia]
MIGRADIEGSKSNVAMNAWLPQASYPCGNFSDTSSFKFRRSKGSLGHAFTVRIRTGNQNQTSFYPSVPHEISVLVELILGHLRYLLTDVPPQPNSPPDNVFRPDRPAEAGLGSKKRGIAPLPIHGISKITLKVVVFHFRPRAPTYTTPLKSFHKVGLESSSTGRIPLVRTSSELAVRRPGKAPEGAVPSPSPGRHAATRSRRGSSSSSPPTADGFGTGTPVPSPQSQSFSRGYGSILPTSLAYIVPSTRGCSPWRPDAVMSTTGRGRHSVLRIFKGRRGRTGHRATCGALPAAGPYLRLSLPFTWNLSPLRPSKFSFEYLLLPPRSAPTAAPPRLTPKVSAQFGTVTRLPVHPASPVLLTKNGPLGALDSVARLNEAAAPSYLFKNSHPGSSYPEGNFGGNQLLDGSISLSPLYPSQTNDLHVSIAAGLHQSFLWLRPAQAQFTIFRVPTGMLTLEPFSEDQGRSAVHPARGIPPISFLAPCGFTHPLTRTHVRLLGPCFKTGRMGCPQAGAGSTQVYRRDGACCQPRSTRRHLHEPIDSSGFGRRTNPHRSTPRVDRRTGYRRSTSDRDASPAPIRFPPDNFKHSLTLFSKSFSSFPRAPRGATGSGHDGALTLSGAPFQGTWARSAAEDASPDYNSDSEAVRFSSWADPGSLAVTKGILVHVHGSFCFAGFDNDPSAGSPTETLLRLLLPLNDKVQWNSRDVAGGEPPTSPRS